ncbi:MAG: hypothetical protein J5506_04125 [Prevotella sp.]|nr:hypothetical protein [Prevotella sp.]
MFFRIKLLLLFALASIGCVAQTTPNEKQARQMFNQVYDMVFGEQGSTLHYAVNIIGIYKTEGTIWYKGKKSKFVDEKYDAYSDGVSYWRAERKKKVVHIYSMNDEKRDKYSTKFKFDPANYNYSIQRDDKYYYLTLKLKKGAKGIKEARVALDLHTRYPQSIRIKVGIFHTTIKISNFKTGGISDQIFVFNKQKYPGYVIEDKR